MTYFSGMFPDVRQANFDRPWNFHYFHIILSYYIIIPRLHFILPYTTQGRGFWDILQDRGGERSGATNQNHGGISAVVGYPLNI